MTGRNNSSLIIADPTRVGSLQFDMHTFKDRDDSKLCALGTKNIQLVRENNVLRDKLEEHREKYQELLISFSELQTKMVKQNKLIRNLMQESAALAHAKPDISENQSLRKRNKELVDKLTSLSNEKTKLEAWIQRRKTKNDQVRVMKQQLQENKEALDVARQYNKVKSDKIRNLQEVVERYSKSAKEAAERTNFSLNDVVQVLRVMVGEEPYKTKKTDEEVEKHYNDLKEMLQNMDNPDSVGFDNLSLQEMRKFLGLDTEQNKKDPWSTFVNRGPFKFRVKTIPSED